MQTELGLKISGHFQAKVYENDILIHTFDHKNLIVNSGLEILCKLVGDAGVGKEVTKISFGANNVPVDAADVYPLGSPMFTKPLDSINFPTFKRVNFDWALELGEHNGNDIYEYALTSDDEATIFAKVVLPLVQKTSLIRIQGSWKIIINAT